MNFILFKTFFKLYIGTPFSIISLIKISKRMKLASLLLTIIDKVGILIKVAKIVARLR